jgi:hypothetical protein
MIEVEYPNRLAGLPLRKEDRLRRDAEWDPPYIVLRVFREYRKSSLSSAPKFISGPGAETGHLSGIDEEG